MCLICVEFEKGKLTAKEARRALSEMVTKLEPDHVALVEKLLQAAAEEEAKTP